MRLLGESIPAFRQSPYCLAAFLIFWEANADTAFLLANPCATAAVNNQGEKWRRLIENSALKNCCKTNFQCDRESRITWKDAKRKIFRWQPYFRFLRRC